MCTAVSFKTNSHYFGRNLDLELSYGEKAVIVPRNFVFNLRKLPALSEHYALIGVAAVFADTPLYYDAVNEYGLGMAGLNFEGNAVFRDFEPEMDNVTPFEFIPYILGQCKTVAEARQLLANINLVNESFNPELPLSPLHWIISDKKESIVVEPMADGLKVYDDPVGVLTNNPTFDKQLFTLNNYRTLSPKTPENTFYPGVELDTYSRGMGTLGLPGDLTSSSRFVKAVFTKAHSVCQPDENSSVGQYFHILGSVEQQKGCCDVGNGKYEYTIYSDCYNTDKGIFYYKTYENSQITALDMHKVDLDGHTFTSYDLLETQQINYAN